jgi:hypothetical protein
MSASKRSTSEPRASDGFATLTADMMERGGATPPPLAEASPDTEQSSEAAHASVRRPGSDVNSAFGKRAKPNRVPKRTKRTGPAAHSALQSQAPSGAHPCQTTDQSDQKVYTGPERRKRDVSPLVERRRSVPPRVKVSVRLEQHRHQRLKGAGVLLGRTHQDLITAALDRYLDNLGILKGPDL